MINQSVLMSDPEYIGIAGINAYENVRHGPRKDTALQQFAGIQAALREAGITITQVPSPIGCQDGVYTANWGVTFQGKALLSRLPNARQAEEAYALGILEDLGFQIRRPSDVFSGQGDTLIFNDHEAILGHGYRTKLTTELIDHFKWLGITPIPVQAKPQRRFGLWKVKNHISGLYDSYYYDIDLAVAVIAPNVLAVCLDALTADGRRAIRELEARSVNPVTVIPVSEHEAQHGFACNTVSTGETVVMASGAPQLKAELERRGYRVLTAVNDEFKLTGGGIRCVSLTLNK
ncbi:MAG TPA: arginine deiminase-related protein [Candidatus Saccharimonadia bacterium]